MKSSFLVFWTMVLTYAPLATCLREETDTYLEAYTQTHGVPLPPVVEYSDPSDISYPNAVYAHHSQPYDSDFQPHSHSYDLDYDPHTHSYEHSYFSKPHFYGPPSGPSGPAPIYGPPHPPPPPPPVYGPHHLVSKGLEFGLSFATLCKILLKVLIFKMIVKFIAVICLLLFFPKLDSGSSSSSSSSSDNNDSERKFYHPNEDDRLNRLTRIVLESIERNSRIQMNRECGDDVSCRMSHVTQYVDKRYTIPRLFSMFLSDYEINQKRLR